MCADDSNWSTADIAKVYKMAARFAGYSDEDIDRFAELESRDTMLMHLNGLRTTGWVDVSSKHLSLKKLKFSSLEELSLKLAIRGEY